MVSLGSIPSVAREPKRTGHDVRTLKQLFTMARISHTSQESKSSNPTTKYLEWKSNDRCFEYYDKDGSGSISVEEIKGVLGVGKNISKKVWDQVVLEVDENGDGEVSFEEFKIMMQ